jgi:hypothetical protein
MPLFTTSRCFDFCQLCTTKNCKNNAKNCVFAHNLGEWLREWHVAYGGQETPTPSQIKSFFIEVTQILLL